tara:strand:- start:774 stop:1964 length:1191 start_codon:yes stop_codon:yes gene_type:complete
METRTAKNGNRYKVYAKVGGKEFTIGSFPIDQQAAAIKLEKDSLTKTISELGITMEPVKTDRITFNDAFKEYFKSINAEPDLDEKTKRGYIAILEAHIQPYISKTYLDEYKAADFKHGENSTKNGLLKSCKIKSGIRTDERIGKLVVQRALQYFKNFLIFCKDNEWNIEIEELLAFNFHPRQLENRAAAKDDWLPKSNDVYNMINSQNHPGKKAWIHMLAETGIELSAALAVCYDDVYYDDEQGFYVINVRHSLDGDSQFRPHYLKTDKRKRKVQITGDLYKLLRAWMDIQMNPITFNKQYKRIFPYRKEYGAGLVKAAAKRAGVNWKKGASPFRKFSASVMYAKRVLDDASFAARYGWEKGLNTFKGFYQKPLSDLNKNKRTAALNNLITNGGNE